MVIVRPIQRTDLDQLEQLATYTNFGLTTLPKDRELLAGRIEDSLHGFDKLKGKPRGETYLFVMEDLDTGKLAGTTGVVSKVGGFEPHWTYRIESIKLVSEMLGVNKEIQTLVLQMEHNGPCEIGSLFLHPDYRGGGRGRLLSVSRFLFMAERPDYFDPIVIAEMRGVIDDQGRSAFWDAVGRHFFECEFVKADYLVMVNKRFIAELMPRHPIYIPLLPPEAQQVIGKVHKDTQPALAILESEGFRFNNEVDIFEGGPIVSCELRKVRAVARSVKATVAEISDDGVESVPYAISNAKREYRACIGNLVERETGVVIHRVTALALGVKVGDPVRYCTLKPS